LEDLRKFHPLTAGASCQNQDLRDYRIFRIRRARPFDRRTLTRICLEGSRRLGSAAWLGMAGLGLGVRIPACEGMAGANRRGGFADG